MPLFGDSICARIMGCVSRFLEPSHIIQSPVLRPGTSLRSITTPAPTLGALSPVSPPRYPQSRANTACRRPRCQTRSVIMARRRTTSISFGIALFSFFLAMWSAHAFAQTDAGGLRVLVLDPSNAIVPGADVRIINLGTNVTMLRVSNSEGYAVFDPIPRGNYNVEVSLTGFRPLRIPRVTIDVNERRLVRAVLRIGELDQTIEVSSAAIAPIQTEQAALGDVIKGDVAVELPLAGRRYTELALLVPGAIASQLTVETRGPGWFVVHGNSHTQNNFILDGFDNNQGTTNMQSMSAQVVQPSPDAFSEFKVQTNSYSAEFGRSAGAVINVSI
ncbi:MAG: carboxypeptidase regulatory-like domain-containing protein, partial [Acidobacteria bacterium]|nr:carboxypeptidase regulatory-like domain-containing protein [Acidobacteriota bacterium]